MEKVKQWQATAIFVVILLAVFLFVLNQIPGNQIVGVVVMNLILALTLLGGFIGLPLLAGKKWSKFVRRVDLEDIDPDHNISSNGHIMIAIASALILGAIAVLAIMWVAELPFWANYGIGQFLDFPKTFEVAPWWVGAVVAGSFGISYGFDHI